MKGDVHILKNKSDNSYVYYAVVYSWTDGENSGYDHYTVNSITLENDEIKVTKLAKKIRSSSQTFYYDSNDNVITKEDCQKLLLIDNYEECIMSLSNTVSSKYSSSGICHYYLIGDDLYMIQSNDGDTKAYSLTYDSTTGIAYDITGEEAKTEITKDVFKEKFKNGLENLYDNNKLTKAENDNSLSKSFF